MSNNVRISLWNEYVGYGSDLGDGTLMGAIDKLSNLLSGVPPEYQSYVKFEFTDEGFDTSSIYLKIWYDRPKTPGEIEAERLAEGRRTAELARRVELQERAQLIALKAKYPDAL